MGDLVWVRFFFPQTSGDRIFLYDFPVFVLFVCLFFSALYAIFFFQCKNFFRRNQFAGYHFYPEITHTPTPIKSSMVGP